MLFRVINKDELPALVRGFMGTYEVLGPVERDGAFVFSRIDDPSQLAMDYTMTALPPKKYLLPHKERLLDFDTKGNVAAPIEYEAPPRVLFGVHACDINAINRLDAVFLGSEYNDPYYRARREATLIVGVSCTPFEECLCGLWGTGEAHRGYDLFLHDIGDSYLVSMYSVEGASLLEATTSPRKPTPEEILAFEVRAKQFHDSFASLPDTAELPMLMDALHKDPIWEELGTRCLSCTACSVTCPTCYCFDIVDTLDPNGAGGIRERVWDSCNSPAFAGVAGGHNFRDSPRNRVRHRFYHKLLSYVARYGEMLCVGCGRCVRYCKANIDPKGVIEGLYRTRDDYLARQPAAEGQEVPALYAAEDEVGA